MKGRGGKREERREIGERRKGKGNERLKGDSIKRIISDEKIDILDAFVQIVPFKY